MAFPVPVLTSRRALAPKLIRRANGELGVGGAASPSSIAFSSIEVEGEVLLPKLFWWLLTLPNGEV